jgi:hypothetical protein
MFFKKKPETKVEPIQIQVDPDIDVKLQVLQNLVLEQRAMIRQILKITTMLSEHKRYELIQVELHKLSNSLDKIK